MASLSTILTNNAATNLDLQINPTMTFDSDDDSSISESASRTEYEGSHEIIGTVVEGQREAPETTQHATTTAAPVATEEGDEKDEATTNHVLAYIKTAIDGFKYVYSTVLLLFSVFLVMAAIFTEQTVGTADIGVHPVLAFFIFWFLICWLATMEGGQGCLVGLYPIDKELYRKSHPRSWKNTTLAHKGNNMERFIVGRQFLVVLVVFVSNMMSSAVSDVDILGLPRSLQSILLRSGVALILVTITIGQLAAQVNAANCMLDFVNNNFMLYFVTYASLAIEFSGLLHCVYLVQIVFAKISGSPVESNELPRTRLQKVFFWCRVVVSLAILAFAFAVTLSALFAGNTTMRDDIPAAVSVIAFFVLMCFVGLMEGMQIALFAVVNLPEDELSRYPVAHQNCQLTFSNQNLQAFLIGRQILVTICMFLVARIATLDIEVGVDENIFGVSNGLQNFFNTGLLGAVITTIVASLAWRIVASSFPIAFLSNPLIYLIIRLCLVLEASGLCSAAWLLASLQRKITGFQPDKVYIGKSEERPTSTGTKEIDLEDPSSVTKPSGEEQEDQQQQQPERFISFRWPTAEEQAPEEGEGH